MSNDDYLLRPKGYFSVMRKYIRDTEKVAEVSRLSNHETAMIMHRMQPIITLIVGIIITKNKIDGMKIEQALREQLEFTVVSRGESARIWLEAIQYQSVIW